MGILVNGTWQVDQLINNKEDGKFVRPDSPFRDWITADGSPGPDGQRAYPAAKGRYHLYVSQPSLPLGPSHLDRAST